jgi:hypothetical protein
VTELASLKKGQIPSYFPWKNPFREQFARKFNLPVEVAMGDAKQMYVEFIE